MTRRLGRMLLCGCVLLSACSKRERSAPDDAGQLPADTVPGGTPVVSAAAADGKGERLQDDTFAPFARQLEAMKARERRPGETLLTGERLLFDYDQRQVQLEHDVVVVDDQGRLEAERLSGRFSASNEVESVEASGGVAFAATNRAAVAEAAFYDYAESMVELRGRARVEEGENRLSGERIRFWTRGTRKMVCEPNALLVVTSAPGLAGEGVQGTKIDTEIRAGRVEYDEGARLARLVGNVRVRDPRAAMDCGEVVIHLKEDGELDWIEAREEVIIQSDDRKALAGRATYHVDEGKFTLEEEPMVKQGLNVMTGDRILFWQATRAMVCEPNARVLLYLDEATRAKFLKDLND